MVLSVILAVDARFCVSKFLIVVGSHFGLDSTFELIARFSNKGSITSGAVCSMSSCIHPQDSIAPKIWKEIKDFSLSSREAAKVFNITFTMAKKSLSLQNVNAPSRPQCVPPAPSNVAIF
jgi:hypothetical protein